MGLPDAYKEDANGNAVYNGVVDSIVILHSERYETPDGIGFMPKALLRNRKPYEQNWSKGGKYRTGWTTLLKITTSGEELIINGLTFLERYGKQEVPTGYGSLWNERISVIGRHL